MADNKNIPQPILKPEIENKYHHYGFFCPKWLILVKNMVILVKYGWFWSEMSSIKAVLVQIMVNKDYLLLSLFV